MSTIRAAWIFLVLVVTTVAQGAGVTRSRDFIVLAPDKATAEQILQRAEQLRKKIAVEWFGRELPSTAGPCIISVTISATEDRGTTTVSGDPAQRLRNVRLETTRERALGVVLEHELTHVMFAAGLSDDLPLWADEGAATQVDARNGWDGRQWVFEHRRRSGNWPSLETIFGVRTNDRVDGTFYGVSATVVEYILTLHDKPTFLRFALAGKSMGWDRALDKYYGIHAIGDLQTAWQARLADDSRPAIASRGLQIEERTRGAGSSFTFGGNEAALLPRAMVIFSVP